MSHKTVYLAIEGSNGVRVLRKVVKSVVTFWCVSLALVSQADMPLERIDRFMSQSGIDEMVYAMPGRIRALVGAALIGAQHADAERALLQTVAEAWYPDSIRASIREYLLNTSSQAEIDALLAWKASPLAKRMFAAEMQSFAPDFQENFARYVETLAATPPHADTMKAISRLVAEAELADIMVDSTVEATRAMAFIIVETGNEDRSKALAALAGTWRQMRADLMPQMEAQAVLTAHYLYRGEALENINRYADFYQSDLGKREIALIQGAMKVAMSEWSTASIQALMARRMSSD